MADQKLPSSSELVTNMVLVGRTCNGKSATGNTLLGQKLFTSKSRAYGATTNESKMFRGAIQDGPIINVIDTPGLFNLSMPADYITKEILNCLTMAKEGIHAVLFVLSVKNPISQEEESALNILQTIFESSILDYFIVVFTGGDELEADGQTLDEYLREGCPECWTRILRLCGGRKVLFDNRTTDRNKKAKQVNQLLAHVANIARQTGGKPYTDNTHRKIKVSQEENDKLREKERDIEWKKLVVPDAEAITEKTRIEHDQTMKMKEHMMEHALKQSPEAYEREIRLMKETVRHGKQFLLPPGHGQRFLYPPLDRHGRFECNIV